MKVKETNSNLESKSDIQLLYVKNLYLWPRFKDPVSIEFDTHKIDLVELQQPLTDQMKLIQKSIFEVH